MTLRSILLDVLTARAAWGRAAVLAAVLTLALAGPAAAVNRPDVVPVVECVGASPDGSRTARLSWDNRTGRTVRIPRGEDNYVIPVSATAALPEALGPGRTSRHGTFTVSFPRHQNLEWHLLGHTATSATAPRCHTRIRAGVTEGRPATSTTSTPAQALPDAGSAAPARLVPARCATEECRSPVTLAFVDVLPSLLVGLVVLFVSATGGSALGRRSHRQRSARRHGR